MKKLLCLQRRDLQRRENFKNSSIPINFPLSKKDEKKLMLKIRTEWRAIREEYRYGTRKTVSGGNTLYIEKNQIKCVCMCMQVCVYIICPLNPSTEKKT